MSTTTTEIPFKRLTLQSDLLPFDCGNPDLTDYFFSSAKPDMQKLLSVTYYLEDEGKTVLFFTLSNDKIAEYDQKRGGDLLFSKSFFRKIKDKFGRKKHRSSSSPTNLRKPLNVPSNATFTTLDSTNISNTDVEPASEKFDYTYTSQ